MIPTAPDSEQYLISLVWQHPDSVLPMAMGDGISRDHFLIPAHAFLWDYFVECRKLEKPIDFVMVAQDLAERGDLKAFWESRQGLHDIWTFAPTRETYRSHLNKLKSAYARRMAIQSAQELMKSAEDVTSESEELEKMARKAVESLSEAFAGSCKVWAPKEACERFVDVLEALSDSKGNPGLLTGIQTIDEVSGGVRRGELWTVSAPTSGGKTVLLLNMAGGMMRAGYKPLIFSLELTVDEVIARILAGTFGADYVACTKPAEATKEALGSVQRAVTELVKCEWRVIDDPEMTAARVHAEVERMVDREGVDALVVDYLQLLNGERARNERADEEISRNMKMFKQMAKKFNLAVMTASQVNDDGRLFGSRAIGFHSDVVLMVEEEGIRVEKNRNGMRGNLLELELDGRNQQFVTKCPFSS